MTKTTVEITEQADGSWGAFLKGGISVAGSGTTREEAVVQLATFLGDLVNERNEQIAGVRKAIGIDDSVPWR